MGRELFYCGTCGKRLSGADLDSGQAIRAGDGYICGECVPEAKTPPPMPSPAPSKKSTARQPLPAGTRRVSGAPPPKGRRLPLVAGGAIVLVAVVVLIVFMFSGGKEEAETDFAPKPVIGTKPPPAPPAPPPAPPPPARPPDAAPSEEDLRKQFEEAAEDLKRRAGEACAREEFGKAVALWEEARPRFESEAWKETVEAEIRGARRQAAALWKSLVEATAAGSREALRDRIKPWGLPEIARELEEMLKPRDLSPALKAYREAWGRALARGAAGEWDAALQELGSPEDAEARAEAEADRALFGKLKALPAVPRVEPGRAVALKYARTPAEYADLEGIVVRADDQRMEVGIEDKKRVFVEWGDLAPASRAALLAGQEAPALAALCLLGGDPAAAEGFAPRDAVPAKYWARAAEGKAAPPARDRREYEARDLFHAAELEWRDPEKLGEAIEKYRTILRDYVGTPIAIRNMVFITRRSEAGKEYVLLPALMKASGPFGRVKIDGAIPAWSLSRDVSGPAEERNTYVEAGFYALPGTSYKGWAFVGACCAETFAVYYQTTEGKGRDPKTRKEYALDPGGGVAMPIDHKIKGLKPTHAAHGGDKKPARWEWIALPIPASYAAPGRKVFRFLASQKGFSVAYVVFSAGRDRPPDKDETAALAGQAPEVPVEAEVEITGLWVKSKKPYEWYKPKAGDLAFIDRKHTIASMPASLAGATALRPANDDKKAKDVPFVRFEVNVDVTVVLAWDQRAPAPAWRKGFKGTGETLAIKEQSSSGTTERPFSLFAKDFPAGKIELGGPDSDKCNVYVAFVVPKR